MNQSTKEVITNLQKTQQVLNDFNTNKVSEFQNKIESLVKETSTLVDDTTETGEILQNAQNKTNSILTSLVESISTQMQSIKVTLDELQPKVNNEIDGIKNTKCFCGICEKNTSVENYHMSERVCNSCWNDRPEVQPELSLC